MNPYDPQRPSPPQVFAGRGSLVTKVAEFLDMAGTHRRSGAILLHGHRGSGKTSALRKIQAMAREKQGNSVVVEVPLRGRSTETALLRDIVEEVRRVVGERALTGARIRALAERVRGINVFGSGVTLEGTPSVNPLTLWRQCLSALEGADLLCVCIDDAELLDRTGLGTLKTLAESASNVPLLLAVAGGPDLAKRLAEPESSPVARAFSGAAFDLEEFTLPETEEALRAPLKVLGGTGKWTDGAIRRLWELSHGYPYLVKCLAYAAYEDGGTIRAEEVTASIPEGLRVGAPWLEREIPNASDLDIIAFARIAQMGKVVLRSSEILGMGIQSPYIGRLVRLGVVKKLARGHYELRKAPVIAYYHQLKRQLSG